MKTVLFFLLVFNSALGWSQTFPVTGQLPTTAFPVCATDTFKQSVVPEGSTDSILVKGCGNYLDLNPFWYTFTCFQGGTLGFLIRPNNFGDDYDWQLFDITGHNPNEVYKNVSLTVIGNWSGTYGNTGTTPFGTRQINCASVPTDNISPYSAMPTLFKGHQYLLLVSHFTNSQSGYSLTFSGGTAVITDKKTPHLQSATVGCDRKLVRVALNKPMRCNSLALDGSDFFIGGRPVSVIGASGLKCTRGFDMDTLLLILNSPLAPGNYFVFMQNGIDSNTLLDDCGSQVAIGESVPFTVLTPVPTSFDSLAPTSCAPNILQLVFSDPIQCSSVAPDGSDFKITGSSIVSISKIGGCSGDLTRRIDLELSAPIVLGGDYQITLLTGSDGNTIINECGVETPSGAKISFITKDTVSASFSYTMRLGCKADTINLNWVPAKSVNSWLWTIDSTYTTPLISPTIIETVSGQKSVQHIVSNGFCSDTVTKIIPVDNFLKAGFQAPLEVCPKDVVVFRDISIGHPVSWSWNFGDGQTSSQEFPPEHLFQDTWSGKTYHVSLVVQDNLGCIDTASLQVTKLQSCFITVPNAFTPNGDGKNDYLYPLNAFLASNLEFIIYNRFGQIIFETRDWTRKWDGTINGKPQGTGTYVWTLRYTDGPSGKQFFLKGSSVLIR